MRDQQNENYDLSDFENALNASPFNQATTAIDQVATIWENVAAALSKYYSTLKEGGIPQDTALQMTVELHTMFWAHQLVPDVHIHRDDIL